MSQSHVQVSNLPPIHIANVQEALAANGDSTVSLISSEEEEVISCYENGDVQPSISIINSSDVVIGSVTQFHGPVTIVQHIPAIEDLKQNGADGTKNKAKLVIGDTVQVTKPRQHTRLPRRLLLCFATVTITLFIIILTLVLAMDTTTSEMPREFPNQYNLTDHVYYTQSEWGGRSPLWAIAMEPPVRWVIISHTVGEQCRTFATCSSQMRLFQDMHVADGSPNIGYNFVIGADGNVYEGRGWFTQNFHTFESNSLSISFAGNYVYDELTDDMVDVFEQLLVLAVDMEVVSPNYRLVAHNQTLVTLSPGPNIYRVIKDFPNFFQDQRPRISDGSD